MPRYARIHVTFGLFHIIGNLRRENPSKKEQRLLDAVLEKVTGKIAIGKKAEKAKQGWKTGLEKAPVLRILVLKRLRTAKR